MAPYWVPFIVHLLDRFNLEYLHWHTVSLAPSLLLRSILFRATLSCAVTFWPNDHLPAENAKSSPDYVRMSLLSGKTMANCFDA